MKIVVYGPEKRTGVLTEGQIIDIAGAVGKKGNAEAALLVDLNTLIMGGQAALDGACARAGSLRGAPG